ncbi:hypothetical protein N7448_010451 [Penicillium atrosanguineum]|uniref:DUF1917-domain-containing protein n=1 Tax=Penicillium atrosanguineum TaxID=1132637 RepID=A0A9W9PNT2_9EURO|nr:hypothetical protein N7526_010380 [Penicillium atrosanguineum]KAJ5119782.1 hypothetical protein N7448_010451 [Penicillium atrosanguineum]KAJ5299542.1 hypothetical protein N7476_011099 [Penicillium atrosanguineum]
MSSATQLDILSDDSSFYGDDDEQARLEHLAATYDPEPFWSEIHPRLLSTTQHELQAPSTQIKTEPMPQDNAPTPTLGAKDRRGPKESISSFLSRLPPSTTHVTEAGPWIWMWGPTPHATEGGNFPVFTRKGTELLEAYEEESSTLRAAHDKSGAKTTAALTRKLNPIRRTLEQSILDLAKETSVTSGKWMFFPSEKEVDATWKTVVTAMDEGKLGDAAKVATNDGSGQARLLCVYTRDFSDKEDVKRVLKTLVAMGLVDEESRPIYYKCDAYTYLDIKSKNDYGLKASLFSSRDVLSGKM